MFGDFVEISKPPTPSATDSIHNSNVPLQDENYDLPLKERIVNHIAVRFDIVLKSQQRNEPDLTYQERRVITLELLETKACQFLYRFGKYLKQEHLQYFSDASDSDEMKFYLQEMQKELNQSTKRVKLRNRRFGALKRMECCSTSSPSSSSSYFSEDEMRKRNPLLYDQLVDRNLTVEERASRIRETPSAPFNNFSEFLVEQIERSKIMEKQKEQEEMEDVEEEEEEEEEGEEEELEEGEKELLREEFCSSLRFQFLSGQDEDFDYKVVDEGEENDLLDWETQDEEERYFDEEEPRSLSPLPPLGEGDTPPRIEERQVVPSVEESHTLNIEEMKKLRVDDSRGLAVEELGSSEVEERDCPSEVEECSPCVEESIEESQSSTEEEEQRPTSREDKMDI